LEILHPKTITLKLYQDVATIYINMALSNKYYHNCKGDVRAVKRIKYITVVISTWHKWASLMYWEMQGPLHVKDRKLVIAPNDQHFVRSDSLWTISRCNCLTLSSMCSFLRQSKLFPIGLHRSLLFIWMMYCLWTSFCRWKNIASLMLNKNQSL
jgi:hypothetical protein